MPTPITQMRIPVKKKELMKQAAKEQGYKSLTAFLVEAGMEKVTGNKKP